jgi:phage baseplate assembly protein W
MSATYFGMNPPFFGGAQNVLSRQEDEQLIKNDILQFILTVKGERVMRPNFGTLLIPSLFEPLDDITITTLSSDLAEGIKNSDKRVVSVNVVMDPNYATKQLYVKILAKFSIDPTKLVTIEQYLSMKG